MDCGSPAAAFNPQPAADRESHYRLRRKVRLLRRCRIETSSHSTAMSSTNSHSADSSLRSRPSREACLGMRSLRSISCGSMSSTRCRAAFTLLEVLAVLSLLVVASALLLPSLQRWQRDISLQQAVVMARTGLNETRLAAIDSASPRGFVFELNGRRFGIVDETTAPLTQHYGELPPDTQFVAVAQSPSNSGMSAPIWFRPDGTASDAELWIADSAGQRQRLVVRRITGGVNCVPDS